ncbi:MAG: energy-coupling factor ABC transporter permease [Ignavibacteria bacterium]|nr:energy-coupling factor ABC transporter permease [Ignavibacteria bacterium]
MHIPDGFLDTKTAVTTVVLAAAGVGIALRRVKREITPRTAPLMGLAAAFVFVAQMLNFPVAGGTSGHLMGSVLAVVLLGPSAGVIVLTSVLVVQSLLFADGGILALGANVLNMAVVGSVGGYTVYSVVRRLITGDRGRLLAAAFAAWCSTVLASIFCAGELAWSGTVTWGLGFPAMANVHMVIGVGEALITAMVIAAVGRMRPDLLRLQSGAPGNGGYVNLVAYGLVMTAGLLIFVVPFGSPWPDGLEKVAATLGFESRAISPPVSSPLLDYQTPGIGSAAMATIMAGLIGSVIVFGLSWILARSLTTGRAHDTSPEKQNGAD